ncbi:MAG: sortase [Eggerthellaceae bacterium]|nr:sortase [Eggerthellaceae bacterium]
MGVIVLYIIIPIIKGDKEEMKKKLVFFMAQHAHVDQNSQEVALEKKKNKCRLLYKLLICILAAIFLVSACVLSYIFYLYWAGQKGYNDLPQPTGTKLEDLTVNWDALRKINPDVVGWVIVPNTPINYPIVQTDNNNTYLRKSFGGEVGNLVTYGCVFLDYKNSPTFTDEMSTLYGHNMNNGSMFSYISELGDQEKFNSLAEYFVLTPAGNYRIKPFAFDHISGTEKIVITNFGTVENRVEYIQDKMNRSIVYVPSNLPDTLYMSHIFMFSTCDNYNTDNRFVLFLYVDESTIPGSVGVSQVLKSMK